MTEYQSKQALADEIKRTAALFIAEFEDVADADFDVRLEGVERTPREMIVYQLGWMGLLREWELRELQGREDNPMPAQGVKWNNLSKLHEYFNMAWAETLPKDLCKEFNASVNEICDWIGTLSNEEVFGQGKRKWASSTPSNWPIWKWTHINTVAPFKTFRSKIRKWRKLRKEQL
jgi:hypothetical protein